jgi:hypothetical protein
MKIVAITPTSNVMRRADSDAVCAIQIVQEKSTGRHPSVFWLGAEGCLVRFGLREGSPAQGIRTRQSYSDLVGLSIITPKENFFFQRRFLLQDYFDFKRIETF